MLASRHGNGHCYALCMEVRIQPRVLRGAGLLVGHCGCLGWKMFRLGAAARLSLARITSAIRGRCSESRRVSRILGSEMSLEELGEVDQWGLKNCWLADGPA